MFINCVNLWRLSLSLCSPGHRKHWISAVLQSACIVSAVLQFCDIEIFFNNSRCSYVFLFPFLRWSCCMIPILIVLSIIPELNSQQPLAEYIIMSSQLSITDTRVHVYYSTYFYFAAGTTTCGNTKWTPPAPFWVQRSQKRTPRYLYGPPWMAGKSWITPNSILGAEE